MPARHLALTLAAVVALGAAPAGTALAAAAAPGCGAAPTHAIPAVQGAGATSPLAGRVVTVRGVVVGDLQAGGLGGFHLQDPKGDGDAATSDAVFVHDPDGAPAVSLGDVVQVTGTATEFHGLTELTRPSSVAVCSRGAKLPAPAPLDLPATPAALEAREGMLVRPVDTLTVTEVYRLARYGEVALSEGGALVQPTEVAEPGDPARAVVAANAARRILLDDGRTTDLSAKAIVPPHLAPADPLRVGDRVAAGAMEPVVLSYGFDAYRLQPADGVADGTRFTPRSSRPRAPKAVGGKVRVGSMNVLNYFVTFGPQSRGAKTPAALAKQQAKIVAGITGLRADVVALQEIENSCVTTPTDRFKAVRSLTAALQAKAGRGRWAYVAACEGSDVITNAIVYRADRVAPLGAPVVPSEDATWSGAREPVAQTFRAGAETFTVVGNHLKSKGSGEGPGNTDTGDGQGKSNAARVAQARSLVDLVGRLKASTKDPDVLLLGDLNAYTKEDPLDVLRAAGLVDLGERHAKGDHSYVFDGQAGSLDHAFATPELAAKVTGLDVWNTNAPESAAYQYDTPFPTLYAPDPYRASDHDPLVLGIAQAGR